MNITPNATLLIQMIHFVVAYQLIARLLCTPAVEFIDQHTSAAAELREISTHANERLDRTRKQHYDQWNAAHKSFIHAVPVRKNTTDVFASPQPLTYTAPATSEVITYTALLA